MMAWGMAPMPAWIVAPSGISAGDVPAMRRSTSPIGRRRVLEERLVDLDPAVDLRAVEERVAQRARHARVDLRDDERRAPRGGQRVAHRDADATEVAAASGGAAWTSTASGAHGPPAANRLTLSK